jgi:hypothetical protein
MKNSTRKIDTTPAALRPCANPGCDKSIVPNDMRIKICHSFVGPSLKKRTVKESRCVSCLNK